MKPNRSCQVCGSEFYAAPGRVAKGQGKYCCIQCRSEAWRGEDNPNWGGGPRTLNCTWCGNEYQRKRNKVNRGENKFCSSACQHAAYPEKLVRVCLRCAEIFEVHPSRVRSQGERSIKYCSRKCSDLAHRTRLEKCCKECGKRFFLKPCDASRSDKKGVGSFCSMACKAKRMSSSQLTTSGVNRNTAKRGGKRYDLGGQYFRSSWEANYARYLNWLLRHTGEIQAWEFEPDTFEFHGIKRGSKFYTPDFRLTLCDGSVEYHEVKGWMDQKSKTKLSRMSKYYPDIAVVLINAASYRKIARKVASMIEGWE